MKTLADFDWRGKIAIIRADLNVPQTANGEIADDTRLVAASGSVRTILNGGGGVVLLSHLGRPQEGKIEKEFSLESIVPAFSLLLQHPIRFAPTLENAGPAVGEVLLLENTRFNVGEKNDDGNLARRYAALGDIFVMDAFASAHRAEASVTGLARCGLPVCAGGLVEAELNGLTRIVGQIERPLVGIFGGAKISTKLAVLQHMAELCDTLLIGGGMANTLLLAQGYNVGASLVQEDMQAEAQAVLSATQGRLVLPQDVVVQTADGTAGQQCTLEQINRGDVILDIGSASWQHYSAIIKQAKTILWNGPVGLFEQEPYAAGTNAIAHAVATAPAYSLVGGADTIAAVRAAEVTEQINYISTGGGALLEYLAGKTLPGLVALGA
ncbi:MAG: phosphoglycerate kinase [Proteobacteria bacterium]|nr:phosphoglycerate kinase [Pseudomonadota bacterium]